MILRFLEFVSRLKSHEQTLQSSVPVVSCMASFPNQEICTQNTGQWPTSELQDDSPIWQCTLKSWCPPQEKAMIPKQNANWQGEVLNIPLTRAIDYRSLTVSGRAWRDAPCVGQSSGPKPVPKEIKQHWLIVFAWYVFIGCICMFHLHHLQVQYDFVAGTLTRRPHKWMQHQC